MNNLKTAVLMAGMIALLMAAGQVLGGTNGLILGSILGLGMNFVMYFFSDRMVLRMYGARVVTEQEAPELYRMVDRLRQRAGLPMPVVAVAPHDQPNAFATGRSPAKAVVAVTTGILRAMPQEELEGVIAHELAHIKNRDMLISTIAAGIAGMIGNLPWLLMFAGGSRDDEQRNPLGELALVLLAPVAAMLIQFAISRQREFEADRVGAEILGRPLPLARALTRLDSMAHQIPMQVAPAAAPLAQVNPLAAMGGGVMRLFSTHPPTEERVARLEAMAAGR
ncbi:MAG: zinc metalloprotease HtpX [Gemmatimonadetes bacterium]|nr:zinc metalloprotease HtpX [Gemmatimonadota bacterium]MBK7786124.1 zinc metalloprotease HtpX [Gemmatimonadota bacterium]MBK9690388.1 zinc metalloprotease HtpX [Gemmatimonadota bacterium]